MLSNADAQNIMEQLQGHTPAVQVVSEFAIANPPMLEQCCYDLPEQDQIPMLKTLVRMEAERISCVGIETFDHLDKFLGILQCCQKNNWLDDSELESILWEVQRWIDAERDGDYVKQDEAEAAIQRICFGLSHMML